MCVQHTAGEGVLLDTLKYSFAHHRIQIEGHEVLLGFNETIQLNRE